MADYTRELAIADIIARQKFGDLNDRDQGFLEEWLAESPQNAELFEKLRHGEPANTGSVAAGFDLERFRNRTVRGLQRRKRRQVTMRIASAAAVLAIGVFSVFMLRNKNTIDHTLVAERTHAILSLPDGRQVELHGEESMETVWEKYTDAEAGHSDGTAGPASLRIDVPVGGEYKLRLSDGTTVWLNSETSLIYPKEFTGGERQVMLSGEAYFDVERDEQLPFIVTVGDTRIKVLGTRFNVAAYQDKRTVTATLLSGAVEVATPHSSVQLTPGLQAVVTKNVSEITVSSVDTSIYSSWVEGVFKFDKMALNDIAARLSRWYDVEFVFEGGTGMERFTGGTWKYVPLNDFLEKIEQVADVSFRMEEGKVFVVPKK